MSAKRKVRRGARPVNDTTPGFKGNLKRFALSFTPSHFRAYWLSKAGIIRVAKLAGLGVLFVVLVFLWYIPQLPNPREINSQIGQTTTFYARDELDNPGKGTKLYEIHGDENRIVIGFDQIPKALKQATIAIEDKNFYNEGAFSVRGLARAASGVITGDSSKGGGSTITQQYVKNALLNDQHSYSRKIKELILSIEINQFYSKDDILKLYLNEIPYGNGAYGIEAACRTYFSDKHGKTNCAEKLSLGESALLAGIPNLPSYYSPYGPNKQALIDRQHLILDLMAEQGYITEADAKAAYLTVAQIDSSQSSGANLAINKNAAFYSSTTAPSFVYTVQSQLEEQYGAAAVEKEGWKVITTLDPNLQNCAELAIYNPGNAKCNPTGNGEVTINPNNGNYTNLVRSKGSNSALVASDPKTGQILAMVGSYNFPESQINMATTPRQPGSSFKPYAYAALMNKNKDANCSGTSSSCQTYGAGSILQDTIAQGNSFGTYKPRDFGGSTEVGGPVTMRTALAGSLNIPAVQALQLAGVPQTIELAKSMGITTLNKPANNYGLSLVLGSGEVSLADHVNAYESFANGGVHYKPTMVLQIRDSKNKIKEDNTKPEDPKRVLDAQVAYIIANMMSDAGARRYAFQNILDVQGQSFSGTGAKGLAVKTGTTEYFNDAWTMGYTPSIVAGVWAGNNDNAPMTQQAANISGPIWKSFMAAALAGKPAETFTKPAGVKQLPNAGNAAQSSTGTDFYPSWYKQTARKQIKIDRVSKKLATDCTPPLAIDTVLDTGVTATDDVHDCNDAKPQVALSGITGGGPYTITAQVTLGSFGNEKTGNGPQQLQIYFDDQLIQTVSDVRTNSYSFPPYSPTTSGSHTFKAVVTDSGYYQATDEQTVTVSDGGGQSNTGGDTFAGRAPANGSTQPSGPVNFTWSALGGAKQYTLFIDGASRTSTPSTSATYPVVSRQTHTWYVRSDTGEQTAPQTFTTQ